jgi:hypothetical protein
MKTRPLVIDHLVKYCGEEMHNESGVKIYSKRTLSELETFVWKNGKVQAMDGYNDDTVMSLGIGLWVRDTALRLKEEGIDLMKSTLTLSEMKKSELVPFYKTNISNVGSNSWKMKTGRQGYGHHGDEDIKWLIQ